MRELEQWIWLPSSSFPDCQTTMNDRYCPNYKRNYKVAEFFKNCDYEKEIVRADIRFSGDTSFTLYFCDKFIARGPASAGGDFLSPQLPHSIQYATSLTLTAEDYPELKSGKIYFRSIVRMSQARLFEFSSGHGGFFLTAHIYFADGTKTVLFTDETWSARLLSEYSDEGEYNNSNGCSEWISAERITNIWHCENSPIPSCTDAFVNLGQFTLSPNEIKNSVFTLDMIYAGYPVIKVRTNSKVKIDLMCRELNEEGSRVSCFFVSDGCYECKELHSAGELVVNAENSGESDAVVEVGFITSCYPVDVSAKTVTSDDELNQVFETCAHTLKYCRQTLHLDSPRHCELLACTGDYYIESLMTAFTFGDQRLSAFDIRRTAELLRYRDGEMFHTTYSLIWVQMLWDIYMLTGDKSLLNDCEDALELLLRRFKGYIGETGLIETPTSYMFIDWQYPDGISTHHPPKALGQTCLNMFYYGALNSAVKIYDQIGVNTDSIKIEAQELKSAIILHLFDNERGIFFEGLNTPTPEHLINEDMPQNVAKRYYRMHANILAAYFGIFEVSECQTLLKKIMHDDSLGNVQPYFCHFLLEAIYRNGLRQDYTLSIIEKWKAPIAECHKGLVEGFYKPEPTYSFDHSHAWGGTPVWSLPLALSGMEILKPGMKKLKFNPSLLGLVYADIEIPTPYGIITLNLKDGNEPVVNAPDNIEIII